MFSCRDLHSIHRVFLGKMGPEPIVLNGVITSNLVAGRGPLWFFDNGEKQRNEKHLLLSKQLSKTSWGWNITHIEIFQTTATHLSLDIQTPAEKMFGPQKYTFNTFSGGIWMFRVILHHAYCISILVRGWTDQTEKYARQNGFIFLNFRGENQKYLKPPPRIVDFDDIPHKYPRDKVDWWGWL